MEKTAIAENRTLDLVTGDQRYVFRYRSGDDVEMIEELMRLAQDAQTRVTWMDAATLAFQVTQNVAVDCCNTVMIPPLPEPVAPKRSAGSDDPKDGPCTNNSSP
jgi:hypothetical protein